MVIVVVCPPVVVMRSTIHAPNRSPPSWTHRAMSVHCLTTHHTSRRRRINTTTNKPTPLCSTLYRTNSTTHAPSSHKPEFASKSRYDVAQNTKIRPECHRSRRPNTHSSSFSPQNQPFLTNQLGGQSRVGGFPNIQITPAPENAPLAQAGNNNNNAVRNPKKRSRASRRAPTTVLTTATANFRAKVHDFYFFLKKKKILTLTKTTPFW